MKVILCQMPAHTPDRNLRLTCRDLGVGNGTSPQLVSDNDRMLENMPVVLNNSNTDKVKQMLESTFEISGKDHV